MKRSMAMVASIVLLIVALSGGVAHAQEPTVSIWVAASDGATYNVSAADVLGFNDGWFAAAPGLLNSYLKANHIWLALTDDATGNVVFSLSDAQIAGMYGPVGYGPPDDVAGVGWACPMPNLYSKVWTYLAGSLPVGSYTLVETSTLDRPVNDAVHTCTYNGEPVTPPPSLYPPGTTIYTVHIVVS